MYVCMHASIHACIHVYCNQFLKGCEPCLLQLCSHYGIAINRFSQMQLLGTLSTLNGWSPATRNLSPQ